MFIVFFHVINMFELLCPPISAAGADLSRTVMSHLDRCFESSEKLLEFAKRGCFMEYDLFGLECSHYQVCTIKLQIRKLTIRLRESSEVITLRNLKPTFKA